ncbi:MAG: peptide-methionine (R)-S-oxide reductase MsrB [Caldilineaceae bacterium]
MAQAYGPDCEVAMEPGGYVNRRDILRQMIVLPLGVALLAACGRDGDGADAVSSSGDTVGGTLEKPRAEWRQVLPGDAYGVLFEERTEPPFFSPLNDEHRAGTFVCAACALPLFSSETKFDSGTGWPSFYAPLPNSVATKEDFSILLPRTEYHCSRCGGHQGHVFDDGPPPTGKRYCNNGLALNFVVQGQPLPPLRS